MKLEDVARAYLAAVELDERTGTQAPALAEQTGVLRADLHALLMQSLRDNHIPFADRSDAARIAHQIVEQAAPH